MKIVVFGRGVISVLYGFRVVLDSHSNMEEFRSTCHDVLAEARRLGVKLPRLEAASSLF